MLALLCMLFLASDPPITIGIPADRQVFQRSENGKTEVPVRVVAPSAIGRMVATVQRASTDSGTDSAPNVLARAELAKTKDGGPGSTSAFEASVTLPDGGWYRIAVSVDGIAGPVEIAHVDRFGVGEVFVVAGQSNSTNYGEERTPSMDDRVSAFDGKHWTLAADPMPGVQDTSAGGSPWPACGKALVEAWNVPVAFASCGYGGTSIRQWQKLASPLEGQKLPLYSALSKRVKALGRMRAILWHQGESDADGGVSTDEYVEKFRALQGDLRKDTGVEMPWVVAHVSYVPGLEAAKMDPIRAAQAQLWKDGVALRGPDTDDMLGALRHSQDKIHFSKSGLVEHAKRWAERLIELFPKKP